MRQALVSLNDAPVLEVVQLWMLRIFSKDAYWQNYDCLDFFDSDQLVVYFPWARKLRRELNGCLMRLANKTFLETGRPADLKKKFCLKIMPSVRLETDDADGDEPGSEAPEKQSADEIIAPQAREAFLRSAVELEVMQSLRVDDNYPLGKLWKFLSHESLFLKLPEKPAVFAEEKARLEKTLRQACNSADRLFQENLRALQAPFGLSELETEVLGFFVVLKRHYGLAAMIDESFQTAAPRRLLAEIASAALDKPFEDVSRALDMNGALCRSGLLVVSERSHDLGSRSDLLSFVKLLASDRLAAMTYEPVSSRELVEELAAPAPASELTLEDFDYLPAVGRVLAPFVEHAVRAHHRGANILLWGMPGTGKTELVRLLAAHAGASLYEVAAIEDRDQEQSRLLCWLACTRFFKRTPGAVLAVDEASDIFNQMGCGQFGAGRTNKGRLNKVLEESPVLTFWITNSLDAIDPSMIRRFDLVLEVPPPSANARRRIVERAFANRLSADATQRLSSVSMISPGVLTRAAKVADSLGFSEGRIRENDVLDMIGETLRAQNYGAIPGNAGLRPASYDPAIVNADVDLEELARGLAQAGGGRLCLYGPPGTGKSAFAAWLAEQLDRPLMRRTYAELSSCFVGETEKLIGEAFREARRSKALLLLDEADSFLRDRQLSRMSWETTAVNEMLTQIENFDGFFVATTNLIDTLDAASLRRFDLKAKFDFLTAEQSVRLAQAEAAHLGVSLSEDVLGEIAHLAQLTPGDFAAVRSQVRFRPLKDDADYCRRLRAETAAKAASSDSKKPIGFV